VNHSEALWSLWHGVLSPGWILLLAIVQLQAVVVLVTVYVHRAVAHRALVLPTVPAALARWMAWWTMGMDPRAFAAVHRRHHATTDTPDDPHAPAHRGMWRVLFGGLGLYRAAACDPETWARHGQGLPRDPGATWYERYPNLGLLLQGVVWIALGGIAGAVAFGVALAWIPLWAGGVVNGLGHRLGYRNHATQDASTNLVPWGVLLAGEELHNNHHADPASACMAHRAFEFDLGWQVIRLLRAVGWAKQVRVPAPMAANESWFKGSYRQRLAALKAWRDACSLVVQDDLRHLRLHSWDDLQRQIIRQTDRSLAAMRRERVVLLDALERRLCTLVLHPPIDRARWVEAWAAFVALASALRDPAIDRWVRGWAPAAALT